VRHGSRIVRSQIKPSQWGQVGPSFLDSCHERLERPGRCPAMGVARERLLSLSDDGGRDAGDLPRGTPTSEDLTVVTTRGRCGRCDDPARDRVGPHRGARAPPTTGGDLRRPRVASRASRFRSRRSVQRPEAAPISSAQSPGYRLALSTRAAADGRRRGQRGRGSEHSRPGPGAERERSGAGRRLSPR